MLEKSAFPWVQWVILKKCSLLKGLMETRFSRVNLNPLKDTISFFWQIDAATEETIMRSERRGMLVFLHPLRTVDGVLLRAGPL